MTVVPIVMVVPIVIWVFRVASDMFEKYAGIGLEVIQIAALLGTESFGHLGTQM